MICQLSPGVEGGGQPHLLHPETIHVEPNIPHALHRRKPYGGEGIKKCAECVAKIRAHGHGTHARRRSNAKRESENKATEHSSRTAATRGTTRSLLDTTRKSSAQEKASHTRETGKQKCLPRQEQEKIQVPSWYETLPESSGRHVFSLTQVGVVSRERPRTTKQPNM